MLYITARDATCYGHGGLVVERQTAQLAVEGMTHTYALRVCRITAVVQESVLLLLDRHEVIAYRHAHLKLAVVIGHHRLTVARGDRAVHIDIRLLHRYGGVLVVRHTAYAERADIVKVHTVVHQRVVTYIAQLLRGVEPVNTKGRHNRVGRSCAGERYALDDIVTVLIRLGFQRQS